MNFQRFLARHGAVKKWMVAADFSLETKVRPLGCFAFTIVPYDAWPSELERDVVTALASDLKNSRSLPPNAIEWLRDNRRFHFAVTVTPTRAIFVGQAGSKLAQAREYIADTLVQAETAREQIGSETMERLQRLKQASQSNGFKVRLLGDVWTLAVLFATITCLIGRDRRSEIIGWYPDRDRMTNWCGGIWHDFAFWDTRAIADTFDIDLRATRIGIGLPDRSTGKDIMWFDYMLRAADWFAGAAAEWDRKSDLDPDKHPKYREMWEQVISGAENVIVLHLDVSEAGAQFRRVVTCP